MVKLDSEWSGFDDEDDYDEFDDVVAPCPYCGAQPHEEHSTSCPMVDYPVFDEEGE